MDKELEDAKNGKVRKWRKRKEKDNLTTKNQKAL